MLYNLLKQIHKQKADNDICVDIFDDGTNELCYFGITPELERNYVTHKRFDHHGKQQYWKLINQVFYNIDSSSDYYIFLPDDVTIEKDFFNKAVQKWNAIEDKNKVALNLLVDNRVHKAQWVPRSPKSVTFNSEEFIRTYWIDMCFICEKKFFQTIEYKINPIPEHRWQNNPNLSSGVGKQISERIDYLGYSLYSLKETLVHHGDHESKMNPGERDKNPLIA